MKKIYFALFATLGFTMNAEAQRNIKLSFEIVKPAMDTNIKTGTTVAPNYKIANVATADADSLQKGDTVFFYDPTCAYNASTSKFTGVSGLIMGGSLPKGYFTTVTYTSPITFDKIVTLVDPATSSASSLVFKSASFTANKMYWWFLLGGGVSAPAGNIGITGSSSAGDTGRVWINKTTAINEVADNQISFNTYPNPAKDRMSFDVTVGANEDLVAQIVDMAGRLVHVRHYGKVAGGNLTLDIDLNFLQSGTYMLNLTDGDKVHSTRFSVQK